MALTAADALVSVPLDFIPAKPRQRALRQVARLAQEKNAIEVVVGLPRHLNGTEGESAAKARNFAGLLAEMLPNMRVCLVDERRSTITAKERLRARGIPEREQRMMIDSVAAQVIVDQAVDLERIGGRLPGEEVSAGSDLREENT